MKTEFFRRSLISKAHVRALEEIGKWDDEKFTIIYELFQNEIDLDKWSKQIFDIATSINENPKIVADIINGLVSLLFSLGKTRDNIKDFLSDLESQKFFSEDISVEQIKKSIGKLEGTIKNVQDSYLRDSGWNQNVNEFNSIGWDAVIVPLREHIYDYEDSIEDYEVSNKFFTGIANISLAIHLLDGKLSVSNFSVDEKSLDKIISSLLACQKELQEAKRIAEYIQGEM